MPKKDDRYEALATRWLALAQENADGLERHADVLRGENRVLLTLLDHPEGLLSGELCNLTNITTGRTANILKQLEGKKFIQRGTMDCDKRKTLVKLTEEGKSVARELRSNALQNEMSAFEELGIEDAEALVNLFERYISLKRARVES